MDAHKFNQKLASRINTLQKIIDSPAPLNPEKAKDYYEHVATATAYAAEIRTIMFESTREIFILPEGNFEARLEKSVFATIEDEGEFFRMAFVSNFPSDDFYIITFRPLASI